MAHTLLDPCKICEFIKNIFYFLIAVFVFGYIGKGIYMFNGVVGVNLSYELSRPSFYIPNGIFWLFGLCGVLIILTAFGVLRCILKLTCNITNRACSHYCPCLDYCDTYEKHSGKKKDYELQENV